VVERRVPFEIDKYMQSTLKEILETMEIPDMRRDITKISNLRWLSRNLAIQNCTHPMFQPAKELIISLIRGS
jgi:hypothetical protein